VGAYDGAGEVQFFVEGSSLGSPEFDEFIRVLRVACGFVFWILFLVVQFEEFLSYE